METGTENSGGRGDALTYVGQYNPMKLLASVLDRLVRQQALSREQADAALAQARAELRESRRSIGRSARKPRAARCKPDLS